jgi:hypothetical protein
VAFNGSGVFQRLYNWINDRDGGIKVRADRMDAEMDGFATGLSNTITKDGQQTITANIPFNGKRITGLGEAISAGDAIRYEQVFGGVSGIIESNADFVDAAIFGPALDEVDWSGRTAAATAALMLATVEDTGADTEVNVWDLTANDLTGPSALATVTISGAATPTSIAARMGYIIVGHEDGITIIDPHDGSWSERTQGWPKSLSTATGPALTNNDVQDVAAGHSDMPMHDPRTGGPMPCFAVAYGTGADVASIIKDDGNVWDKAATIGNPVVAITDDGYIVYSRSNSGDEVNYSNARISAITADDWSIDYSVIKENTDDNFGLGVGNGFALVGNKAAGADATGLTLCQNVLDRQGLALLAMNALVNRTYNSGLCLNDTRIAAFANSITADRWYNGLTLTNADALTLAAVNGGDLQGVSGFSSSKFCTLAYDALLDPGTNSLSFGGWVKSDSVAAGVDSLIYRCDTGLADGRYSIEFTTSGALQVAIHDASAANTASVVSGNAYDDGNWHLVFGVRDTSAGLLKLYIDGRLDNYTGSTSVGSLSNASALLRLGIRPDGNGEADTSTMALWRVAIGTAMTDNMARQMYEAERGMFDASAECLLQSGATDEVLDVSIDPITGKVAVTQTDNLTIWDGLVVDSEPAIATGGTTWEHNLLHGGDRFEINDANLYATVAAKDLRGDMEVLRGLKAGLPADVDLSKAKAWLVLDGTGTIAIHASHNIKSITDNGTGDYTVEFGVPFRDPYFVMAGVAPDNVDVHRDNGTLAASSAEIHTRHNSTANLTDTDPISVVFFGELENE